MATKLDEILKGNRDAITVKRVFGEPVHQNGVTVIPAAKIMGGGGGGEGEGEGPDGAGTGRGSGSGYGMLARPAGAYVIRGDDVHWQPAIDVNRIIAGAFAIAALALVVTRRRDQ